MELAARSHPAQVAASHSFHNATQGLRGAGVQRSRFETTSLNEAGLQAEVLESDVPVPVLVDFPRSGCARVWKLARVSRVADFSLTFLGTGTSVGVPVIGCDCEVCTSQDPRNNRTRSSVLVRAGGKTLLVDSGPDLRIQALREGIREIDAVVYTHAHVDHVVGFDELRAFCWRRTDRLPMHATESCLDTLKAMFGWAFAEGMEIGGYVKPDPRIIEGPFYYGDLKLTPLPVEHGAVETIGYLFEFPGARSLAYLPDVKSIPDKTLRLMLDVDVLVVDALRTWEHPTHFSLADALEASEKTRARETWLTHLSHEYRVDEIAGTLPPSVRMAWDGLRISLNDAPGLA